MKLLRYHILFLLCLSGAVKSYSQVVTQEVIDIYTGFSPKLAEVEKFYDQPSILDTFKANPDSVYTLNTEPVKVFFYPDTIPAIKMKGEPLQKLHRFYLKAGFGNYLTPFIEAHINSLRAKNNSYAFRYTHFSSHGNISNVGQPWLSDNEAMGNYNHFFKTHTLNISGIYRRNVVHYYGYDPQVDSLFTRDTTRQRFNRAIFNTSLISNYRTDSIKVNHRLDLEFRHVDDFYGMMENSVKLGGELSRFTDLFAGETFGGMMNMNYVHYKNNLVGDVHGFFMDVTPFIKFGGKDWSLLVGPKLALGADDTVRFNVYPEIDLQVNIFRKFVRFYVQTTGRYERNFLDRMTAENPFLKPNAEVKNLNEYIRGKAGFKGAFTDNVSYNAGVQVAYAQNMVFYANDTLNKSQRGFTPIYDQGLYFNAFGELSVAFGEKIHVAGKINYHLYKPENISVAWHKPFLDGTISASYNLRNKLIFKTDLYFISPQQARTYIDDPLNPGTAIESQVELKGLIDVNISAEYRLKKWLSFFVNVNNIAAMRYNRWYQYPTQGLNVLGGFSLAF